jgi:hypothetical protein
MASALLTTYLTVPLHAVDRTQALESVLLSQSAIARSRETLFTGIREEVTRGESTPAVPMPTHIESGMERAGAREMGTGSDRGGIELEGRGGRRIVVSEQEFWDLVAVEVANLLEQSEFNKQRWRGLLGTDAFAKIEPIAARRLRPPPSLESGEQWEGGRGARGRRRLWCNCQ